MGLDAQPPARMSQAIFNGRLRIGSLVGPVHGLQPELIEWQVFQVRRVYAGLRENQLKFLSLAHNPVSPRLGTGTKPIYTGRRAHCSVGFHRDFKAARMNSVNQGSIELKQRLAAGKDYEAMTLLTTPCRLDKVSQLIGGFVFAAQCSVCSYKVCIAKLALSGTAILFASRPEVAAGKAAKHGRPTSLTAFTLQGQEYFFY